MCIAQYDATGDILDYYRINKRKRTIICEIIEVLNKYDLTVGQAKDLLRACNSFIDVTLAKEALKDYVPNLMNGLHMNDSE